MLGVRFLEIQRPMPRVDVLFEIAPCDLREGIWIQMKVKIAFNCSCSAIDIRNANAFRAASGELPKFLKIGKHHRSHVGRKFQSFELVKSVNALRIIIEN